LTDDRIVAVTMPKWGLSMQLGKITAWAVAEGDEVQAGDDLADIETEKITGTLEAADAGTVRRIIARVGEDVPVSGTIALIAPADVGDDALDAAVLGAASGEAPEAVCPPHRWYEVARAYRRGRHSAGKGVACRREGARRTPDARRPRAQ